MQGIDPLIAMAYAVLDGDPIEGRTLVDELAAIDGKYILDLVSLANKVRIKFANEAHVCTILNAKSGQCGEDCRFCASRGTTGPTSTSTRCSTKKRLS